MSDDEVEDAVKLERRLTLMEASIKSGFATLTTSVNALTGKVGDQNGRIATLEVEEHKVASYHATEEAREEGRTEVTRRHLGWATGTVSVVIVASQVAIQAFW
jgi:hypothetical protein